MIHFSWMTIIVCLITGIPFLLIVAVFWNKLRNLKKLDDQCCHRQMLESKIRRANIVSSRIPPAKIQNGHT